MRGSSVAPAQQRADRIAENIINFAKSSAKTTVEVKIIDGEFGPTITADGINMAVVTLADAKYENMKPELLEKVQAKIIEKPFLSIDLTVQKRVKSKA